MHKTKHKIFWAWQSDRESQWLNQMAAKGWSLCGANFCTYHFEETVPGRYTVALALFDGRSRADYIQFVEGTGATYLGRVFNWLYFRKEAAQGPFSLYSDHDSRIGQLNRILTLLTALLVLEVPIGIINVRGGIHNGVGFSLGVGAANLLLGLLILYGLMRTLRSRAQLRRERTLYE